MRSLMSVAFLDWIVGAAEVSFSSRAVWLHRRHVPTSDTALEVGNCSLIFGTPTTIWIGRDLSLSEGRRCAARCRTIQTVKFSSFVSFTASASASASAGPSVSLLGLVASGANYPVLLQSLL